MSHNNKGEINLQQSICIPWLICVLLFVSCNIHKPAVSPYDINKSVHGKQCMVVTAHPAATEVGLNILRAGGNAIDAAIAVQFALAVVYPVAGNIGGGGFMVIRMSDGSIASLDFREKAPAKAQRDMYLDEEGNILFGKSTAGHLSAGVPGTVDGMARAFKRFGSVKNLKDLVTPAHYLAKHGFPVTERQAAALNYFRPAFASQNGVDHPFNKETIWRENDLLIQPDMARTLKHVQKKGREGFYGGKVANLIVQEMTEGHGFISHQDLKNYQAIWRSPIVATYKNLEVLSMGPPSSGGICLAQLLNATEPFNLAI